MGGWFIEVLRRAGFYSYHLLLISHIDCMILVSVYLVLQNRPFSHRLKFGLDYSRIRY